MFMRRRRPLMRAAMVGGAGYYAGKKVQQGREAEADQDERLAQLEQAQYAQSAPQAPPPAASSDEVIQQLQKLGQLKDQGILTQEEFDAQKQKLLASM
jgi:hypothetical protein